MEQERRRKKVGNTKTQNNIKQKEGNGRNKGKYLKSREQQKVRIEKWRSLPVLHSGSKSALPAFPTSSLCPSLTHSRGSHYRKQTILSLRWVPGVESKLPSLCLINQAWKAWQRKLRPPQAKATQPWPPAHSVGASDAWIPYPECVWTHWGGWKSRRISRTVGCSPLPILAPSPQTRLWLLAYPRKTTPGTWYLCCWTQRVYHLGHSIQEQDCNHCKVGLFTCSK